MGANNKHERRVYLTPPVWEFIQKQKRTVIGNESRIVNRLLADLFSQKPTPLPKGTVLT